MDLICEECGEVRIKTPSGAVCPAGHGRIKPGVTESELAAAERLKWAESLPRFARECGTKRVFVRDGKRYLPTFFGWTSTGGSKVYRVPVRGKPRDGTVVGADEHGEPRCFVLSSKQPANVL